MTVVNTVLGNKCGHAYALWFFVFVKRCFIFATFFLQFIYNDPESITFLFHIKIRPFNQTYFLLNYAQINGCFNASFVTYKFAHFFTKALRTFKPLISKC